MEIRATEAIAREVIQGQIDEILGLINPVNDGNLAAWMMAGDRAKRLVGTLQTVCDAITARPFVRPADATQYTAEDFGTLNPAEEAAFDQIEAQAQQDAEARQVVEAERINAAHPEVFSLSDFAAKSLGMSRGA